MEKVALCLHTDATRQKELIEFDIFITHAARIGLASNTICECLVQVKKEISLSITPEMKINPMFDQPKYPMYVMMASDIVGLSDERLPRHEDAKARGLLYEVCEMPGNPGKLFVYHTLQSGDRGSAILYDDDEGVERETKEVVFHRARFSAVSHRWLRPSRDPVIAHPDSEDNIKFTAIKKYLKDSVRMDNCEYIFGIR
jgi:hypothetical protein